MLVMAVDIVDGTDPDRAGEAVLFAGGSLENGCPSHRPTYATATSSCACHTQGSRPNPLPSNHTVDVQMLLCPVLCHHVGFIACGCPAQHRRTQPSRSAPPATPRRTITDRK